MITMIKIFHWFHTKEEIFNKILGKRIDKITELEEKVNPDDLIYKYKGQTANVKFNEFDNAYDRIDKIREGKTTLADAKNDQAKFKSSLGEIKKGNKKIDEKRKKTHCIILKCVTKQGMMPLNFSMISF